MLLFSFTKLPNKSNIKEEQLISAHGLRVRSTVEAKAWWREREAAGHMASAVWKQRLKNSVFSSLSPVYATLMNLSHSRVPPTHILGGLHVTRI